MSGFTRIEAIDDFGGSVLLFWNPSTVMMAWPGAPPLVAASTCSWRLKSSGSSAMPLQVLGGQCVCAGAVIGIDGDSVVFSYLDLGVNIGDAQMDSDVLRGLCPLTLVSAKPLSADSYLVGLVPEQGKVKEPCGPVVVRASCAACRLNVCAHDRGPRGIEHRFR